MRAVVPSPCSGPGRALPFPPTNRDLLDRIVRDHAAVSQFPPGTPPKGRQFPMRNRVIALFTHAVVIVEASERSGTRHVAREALRLGRGLFLDEHVARGGVSWADELTRRGAEIITPQRLRGILDEWLPIVEAEAAVERGEYVLLPDFFEELATDPAQLLKPPFARTAALLLVAAVRRLPTERGARAEGSWRRVSSPRRSFFAAEMPVQPRTGGGRSAGVAPHLRLRLPGASGVQLLAGDHNTEAARQCRTVRAGWSRRVSRGE